MAQARQRVRTGHVRHHCCAVFTPSSVSSSGMKSKSAVTQGAPVCHSVPSAETASRMRFSKSMAAASGARGAVGDGPYRGPVRAETWPDAALSLEPLAGQVDGVTVVAGRCGESAAGCGAIGDEPVDGLVAGGYLRVSGSADASCGGLLHDNLAFTCPVG